MNNDPVHIIFSCVANEYNLEEDFRDLRELNIQVRETVWKKMSRRELKQSLSLAGKFSNQINLNYDFYQYPCDGLNNFNDCDFWFIISDRTLDPIVPLKPYGMVIYDYIQRYIPEIFTGFPSHLENAFLHAARKAQFIFTTTPYTREDVIQYAGVAADKVHVAPMDFSLSYKEEPNSSSINKDYFIWTTNLSYHKNHMRALEALEIYYNEFDGAFKTVITGVDTEFLQWNSMQETNIHHINQAKKFIEKNSILKKYIKVLGYLSTSSYISVLASAKFLWHPALMDNGTYTVIEAAYHNVPALSSSYPQMHYINERFQLNLNYCDPSQSRDMALKIKEMEIYNMDRRKNLPSRDFLSQFSPEELAKEFWLQFRGLL